MKKNKENNNALIKQKAFYELIRREWINSVSPEVFYYANKNLKNLIKLSMIRLKEKLEIKGRKTLKSEDFKEAFSELISHNIIPYME